MANNYARPFLTRPLVIILIALVTAAGTIAGLELSNTTHWFHQAPVAQVSQPQPESTTQQTKPTNSQPSDNESSTTIPPSEDTPSSKHPGTVSPAVDLLAPQGTFVNQYDVTLSQELSSTCNTNAGAECQIIFYNDSGSHSLPARLTDADGSVAWAWRPKSIGLSPGTWHIKAVASYQGQTKTTSNDPLTLQVSS